VSEQEPEERRPARPWVLPAAIAILLALLAAIYFLYPVVQRDLGGTAQRPTPKATPKTTPKPSPRVTPLPSPKPKPPKPPRPVTSGVKTPIAGLLDRKGPPTSAYYSVIDGYVVNVNWSSLQAFPGAAISSGNQIDRAIAQVRQANAAGAHMSLKLRIFTGIAAPIWVKNIGGPPVSVRDPQANISGTIGRFWLPAFGRAYQDLEIKLAAKYDTVPEIREVSISRCMTSRRALSPGHPGPGYGGESLECRILSCRGPRLRARADPGPRSLDTHEVGSLVQPLSGNSVEVAGCD